MLWSFSDNPDAADQLPQVKKLFMFHSERAYFQDNIPFLKGVAASEQSSREAEPQRNAFPTILQQVQFIKDLFTQFIMCGFSINLTYSLLLIYAVLVHLDY